MKTFILSLFISSAFSFGGFNNTSSSNHETITKDCTMKVKIETEDGTTITGTVTVKDISWWECTKLKVGNFISKVF